MIEPTTTSAVRQELACRDLFCIFEVKERSPFGWVSPMSRYEMLAIAEQGDMVSIHTNELWGGSWKWLEEARRLTSKPILAKGFHPTTADVRRAFDCGADAVLTAGWWPDDSRCWHECETPDQMAVTDAPKAVWNTRNPRNGGTRPILDARSVRKGWLCLASNIRKETVVDADAALIGAGLYMQNSMLCQTQY